jgi:hypothetical protein
MIREGRRTNMAHRIRPAAVLAVAFLTFAGLAQGQEKKYVPYSGGSSSSTSANATAPAPQGASQQQGYGTQGQGQTGNSGQGMAGPQALNPNQNGNKQGQGNEEAPAPKPRYLTYTVKEKSLEEQAKSGKAAPVDFKSVPAGAAVTVDGYYEGNTPITTQIPVGKHLVSITKWGYESWQQELNVSEGKALSLNPTLHKDW